MWLCGTEPFFADTSCIQLMQLGNRVDRAQLRLGCNRVALWLYLRLCFLGAIALLFCGE